jgi:hypothetical protein
VPLKAKYAHTRLWGSDEAAVGGWLVQKADHLSNGDDAAADHGAEQVLYEVDTACIIGCRRESRPAREVYVCGAPNQNGPLR